MVGGVALKAVGLRGRDHLAASQGNVFLAMSLQISAGVSGCSPR
jgi:hypothetical protein